MERINVGTSGWSYKHWKGNFYPAALAAAEWLRYYASHFSTTEINNCFYRLPGIDTVQNWTETVPGDFFFCPKMHQFLSHMKKLKEPVEPLQRFFDVFAPMQSKMGPVLIQLPAMLKFDSGRAEDLYRLLQTDYHPFRFVMEVRHPSWMHQESLQLMRRHNIALVISQSGDAFPYKEVITADHIYVRFHGPQQLYASSYSDELLKKFAKKFRLWAARGHTVWAFFNNDIHGYAPVDALRLLSYIQ